MTHKSARSEIDTDSNHTYRKQIRFAQQFGILHNITIHTYIQMIVGHHRSQRIPWRRMQLPHTLTNGIRIADVGRKEGIVVLLQTLVNCLINSSSTERLGSASLNTLGRQRGKSYARHHNNKKAKRSRKK